jgi:hypothetical protein
MFSELFTPLYAFAKEDTGIFLGLFLLLTVGFTAIFSGKNTLKCLWGLMKVAGRILVAPVRFVSRYMALTHSGDDVDALPWISRQAPLSMANLSFVSSFTAFSGIILLAATVLMAGKALLPDPAISRAIKAIVFYEKISQPERAIAQDLLVKIRAAGPLDQMGRNDVYERVGKSWTELLQEEQRQLEEEIDSDPTAKDDLARASRDLPSKSDVSYYISRLEKFDCQSSDRYFVNLIYAYLGLNVRIERSRIDSAPVIYEWQNGPHYKEILSGWESTAKKDPSEDFAEKLSRLRELNKFNWTPMLSSLAMGLAFTWAWIWLCGICVESLNLLLGHFEWVKQLQEDSSNRAGKH